MAFNEKYVQFDGSNEYATAGDVLDWDRDQARSWSFWIKTSPGYSGGGFIIAKQNFGNPEGWSVNWESADTVGLRLVKVWPTDMVRVGTSVGSLNDGSWHHIVITWSGSTGLAADCKMYVDGAEDTSLVVYTNNLTATISNANDFWLGGRQAGDVYYQGGLDEVAIYDKELSQAEVTAIYNSGEAPDLSLLSSAPNLVAWWRMGDGDVFPVLSNQVIGLAVFPTIPDASGPPNFPLLLDESTNGYDGTMVNKVVGDIVTDSPGGSYSTRSCQFTDPGEYITMGDVAAFGFEYSDPFSFSCWFKTSIAFDAPFISKMSGAGVGYYLEMRGAVGGPVRFTLDGAGGGGDKFVIRSTGGWNDGAWHHVCATYDGSNTPAGITIWIDGNDETSVVEVDGPIVSTMVNSNGFWLGARTGDLGPSAPYEYTGFLDEVAVYDKELSGPEVTAIYNAGVPNDLSGLGSYSNILAWWRMGEGIHGFDGTMINMEPEDITATAPGGPFSTKSCVFDGSNEYITMGNVLDWDRLAPRSYSFWYKTTTTSTSVLIAKHGSGLPDGWTIAANFNGKLVLDMVEVAATSQCGIESSVVLNNGAWHHVVLTWSGATGTASDAKFYFDGTEDTSLNVFVNTLSGSIVNSFDFQLARRTALTPPADLPFAGSLDEVALYDKVLSQAEVTAIYNGGAPNDLLGLGSAPNLISWWRMGEGYAHGTMVNMEAEDIKNLIIQIAAALQGDAFVTALGGFLLDIAADLEGDATISADLLGELEVAADLAGQATFTGVDRVDRSAIADLAGMAEIIAVGLVREDVVPIPTPVEQLPPRLQRLVGFQPDREPVVQPPKLTVSVTPARPREASIADRNTGIAGRGRR